MQFNWKIGGEAGFGIMTSGLVFSKIATRSGYLIFDYTEYPSLIRGGHNTYEVLVSDEAVQAPRWEIDLLVCLNEDTYKLHSDRLTDKSMVIYDPDVFDPEIGIKIPITFGKIKKDEKIDQMMMNTIAVGASLGILGGDLSIFEEILHQQFDKKGKEVADFNLKLAKIGYDEILKNNIKPLSILKKKDIIDPQMVITGNEAFALGAMAADCRYYVAYPMTPASTVLGVLASWQYKNKMVVRHIEDEISAVNTALGASYAGVRSSVGSSGGGFALMVEGLSYAGIAEIPLVVLLAMRSGPATGMPTWTEQGDLLFAVHAGHGEFPKIVLTPGDPEEMIALTLKAFDLADIYQSPVIVITDKFLSESHSSLSKKVEDAVLQKHKIDRGKIVNDTEETPYLRYLDTKDGVSPMLIPGKKGIYYQANSYEHIEDSHTTEDLKERVKQVDKRLKKNTTYLKNHFELPKIIGDLNNAEIVFVSFGSMKGPIVDAMKLIKTKSAYIHFTHVYPLAEELVQQIFARCVGKRMILVENNSTAQFGQLLRMQTGIIFKEKLLKYDGRPIWPEEILLYVDDNARSVEEEKNDTKINAKVLQEDSTKKEKEIMDKLAAEMSVE